MKRIRAIAYLLFFMTFSAYSGQAFSIELTQDNPATLIGTKSTDYRIFGLRLGLTQQQALEIIDRSGIFVGRRVLDSESRAIAVVKRLANGKEKQFLLLQFWSDKNDQSRLISITVMPDAQIYLSDNFRRLLSFEMLDDNSDFKRNFIGNVYRQEITDFEPISKHKSHIYDNIGLAISHVSWKKGWRSEEEVHFIILPTR